MILVSFFINNYFSLQPTYFQNNKQFVISLLEEIIWNAENLLFEKYIEKQIIPFTLNFFENTIMEIIDWNFYKYDNGIINEDAWCPDTELTPIINDSWARGAIPVKQLPLKKSISENNQISSVSETKKSSIKKSHLNKGKQKKIRRKSIDNNIITNSNSSSKSKISTLIKKEKATKLSESKPKKVKSNINSLVQNNKYDNKQLDSKEKQKTYHKNVKNKTAISDIINNKQSTIQIQNMTKEGWNIDNIYNYTGHLISTIKNSPEKSFEQNIKAHLIEPIKAKQKINDRRLLSSNSDEKNIIEEETINISALYNNNDLNNNIEKLKNDINNLNNFIKQKQSVSPEVERALRKKNITPLQKISKMKKNGNNDKLDPLLNYNKKDINYNYEKYVEDDSLEIPSFINSISIAPGVKLYEGNSFKSGPSLYPNNLDENSDPKILLLKKGKQNIMNSREPHLNNELLKDIILKAKYKSYIKKITIVEIWDK